MGANTFTQSYILRLGNKGDKNQTLNIVLYLKVIIFLLNYKILSKLETLEKFCILLILKPRKVKKQRILFYL